MKSCGKSECLLYDKNKYPICEWYGNNKAEVMIVSEPPTFHDTKERLLFAEENTRDKIQQYLEFAGLSWNDVFFTSVARCQINKKEFGIQKDRDGIVNICKTFVEKAISALNPKVIITMGDYATKVIGGKNGITKDNVHGNAFWSDNYNCWIFPVFGMSYLFRNEGKEYLMQRDFAKLKILVKSGYKISEVKIEKPEKNYSELQALSPEYIAKCRNGVALDTETQGLEWYNKPFICLGYSICCEEDKAHWITFFEETTRDKADFFIYWNRALPGGASKQKLKTKVFIRKADNFEQKIKTLKTIIEAPNIPKFFHHGSFDIHAMTRAVEVAGKLCNWPKDQWTLKPQNIALDTQFGAHVMNENIFKLISLEKLQELLIKDEMPYNYNAAFGNTYDKSDMLAVQRDHKEDFIWYSCLSKDSKVFMADGSRKKIGDLVRNKSTEKVLSFNEATGSIEAMPIEGWVKKPHRSKEWYRIKYKCTGKNIYNRGTLNGPAFTPDHEILTDKGYVRIDSLDPNIHRIATGDRKLTVDSIALLLGCLLGDGTLVSRNGAGYGFSFTQSENRKSFFDMIHAIFPEAHVDKYKRRQRDDSRNSVMLRFTSQYTKELTQLREMLSFVECSQHLKLSITKNIWHLLSPASLAVWYFSDGTFQKNTENTRIYRTTLTNDVQEQQNIITWLRHLGVKAHYHDGGGTNRYIHIDASNRDYFFEIIAPYATTDVLYKIPERYHNNVKKELSLGYSDNIYYAPFEAVVPWHPPKSNRGFATAYCLQIAKNHNFLTDIGFVHNCADSEATWRIARKLIAFFKKPGNEKLRRYVKEFGTRSYNVLAEMEDKGLYVDAVSVPATQEYVVSRQAALQADILKLMPQKVVAKYADDLKLSRDCIIRDVLYDKEIGFGVPVLNRTGTSGAPSIGKDTRKLLMEKLTGAPKDFIVAYHQYEALDTLRTRYLKSLVVDVATDGFIHPNLSLSNTDTGRSSSSPNLQNFPKQGEDAARIRRLIIAPPGWELLKADESQAELRWAAILSGDETMKDVFRKNGDIHITTGERLAGRPWDTLTDKEKKHYRQNAKPVNFGLLYLMSAKGFQLYAKLQYGIDMTLEDAENMIKIYFETYSKLTDYHEKTIAFGEKHGYVETPFGRRRRLPELRSADYGIRNEAQRKAVNVPIQGASSDLVILAGSELLNMNLPSSEIKLCMFIHDELIFLVKKGYAEKYAPIVKKAMEHPPLHKFGIKLDIPLRSDVSVGPNFYDCKEAKFDGYNFIGYKED